ncbi:sensor histidine kinase [Kribbella sandramycini]|uniref:histidine kinase n=1 Tax=Kribbella sandramycini TaxID=60450 RepID=A0A7Y4L5S8_9ACTN|nr:histidine kinase [Kribbella sandramycini]MBB6570580.1 signal transduction histidine kinase [Kribbella sandramycini]NOL43726.1 sensor histidine kinase [Kribbella sandramycini]
MVSRVLARGVAACGYLTMRCLKSMLLFAATPICLLVIDWAPWVRGGLVRLAKSELAAAYRYLGRPAALQLPPAAARMPFRRSLWLYLGCLVMIPELFLAVAAFFAIPAALLTAVLWPLDPGSFTMMGVPVDSWWDIAYLAPLQLLFAVGLLSWLAPAAARGHAKAAGKLLALTPDELENARLAQRVEELTRTRSGAVDSHGAELRRIERDLHDGTQAQLVSLAMRIGIAKQTMADDPEKAAKLLDDARDGAEQAMHELRGVLRTMYPPILQDRGLTGAVAALCARCPLPVELRMGELGQVPAAVEAAAYFVVAESLTNVTKHSAAGHVDLLLERRDHELYLAITDDGIGGARINEQSDLLGRGSGLHGMLHRVQAIDGHLELTSPIGGPTTVEVLLPCE